MADALDAAPTAPARATPRQAAEVVLAAWTDETNRETDVIPALEGPMAALRIALAGKAGRPTGTPRIPRKGTKQPAVLALLRRDEGATIAQIMEATAWQSHTVRGVLAGLKKKGIQVDVLDRVRQVGPDTEGAKGPYSISRRGLKRPTEHAANRVTRGAARSTVTTPLMSRCRGRISKLNDRRQT